MLRTTLMLVAALGLSATACGDEHHAAGAQPSRLAAGAQLRYRSRPVLARLLQLCVLAALIGGPGGSLGTAAAAIQEEAACCADCEDDECPDDESEDGCPPRCNDCVCASFGVVAALGGSAQPAVSLVHAEPPTLHTVSVRSASGQRVFRPPRS